MARLTEVEIGMKSGDVQTAANNLKEFGNAADTAGGKTKRLEADLVKTGSAFDKLKSFALKAIPVITVLETISLAKDFVQSVLAANDALHKMAIKTGVAVEELQAYQHAAGLSGVSNEKLENAFGKLNNKLEDLQSGNKAVIAEFNKLGISMTDADGKLKTTDQAFLSIAERVANATTHTDKLAIANAAFGDKLGREMLPMLNEGKEGLERMKTEAHSLGLVIGEEVVNNSAKFNDAIDTMKKGVYGFVVNELGGLITFLANVVTRFMDARRAGMGFIESLMFSTGFMSILEKRVNELKEAEAELAHARKTYTNDITVDGGYHAQKLEAAERKVRERLKLLNEESKRVTKEINAADKAAKNLNNGLTDLENNSGGAAKGIKNLVDVEANHRKELDASRDALDRLQATLDPVIAKQQQWASQLAVLDTALVDGHITFDEYIYWLNELGRSMNKAKDATVKAADKMSKVVDPMAQAWEKGMERVDEAFASAWKGSFDSFKDFGKNLKQAFLQLLGEMAHMATTRKIMVSLGITGGVSGAANAATGGSGGGGVLETLSNLSSMMTAGSLMTSFSTMLSSFGAGTTMTATQLSNLANAGLVTQGAGAAGWAAANVGPYAAAFMAAQKAGPIAGMAAGAGTSAVVGGVGALASGGSFMGGATAALSAIPGWGWAAMAVLAIVGSVLGNKKPSDKSAWGTTDLATGETSDIGSMQGKKFSQENNDARDSFLTILGSAGEAIRAFGGTVTGKAEVTIGNRDGLRMKLGDGEVKSYGNDPQKAIIGMLTDIFKSASGVAEHYMTLILKETDPERFLGMAGALAQLKSATETNPVTAAAEAFAQVQPSMTEAYRSQVTLVNELVTAFDGSYESATALSSAYVAQQEMAYTLAVSLKQVAQEVQGLFGNLANEIAESQMTAEALYNKRDQYVDELMSKLAVAIDPAEIMSLSTEIERVTRLMWNSLEEGQQALLAGEFITFLTDVSDLAQERVDLALGNLDKDFATSSTAINDAMVAAANNIAAATSELVSAASEIRSAAAMFKNINVNVTVTESAQQVGWAN